jgi:hypothetical protein
MLTYYTKAVTGIIRDWNSNARNGSKAHVRGRRVDAFR